MYIIVHVKFAGCTCKWTQVNAFEFKIGGTVERVWETSSNSGIHDRAITVLHKTVNVSWKAETHTQLVTPYIRPFAMLCRLCIYI